MSTASTLTTRSWDRVVTFAGHRARVTGVNDATAKDQDRAGVTDDCLVVADGVTPLGPHAGTAVQAFAEAVVEVFLSSGDATLAEVLTRAVDASPAGADEVPACAVGAARAVGGQIELSSVADTAVAARCRDGRIVTCVDERVTPSEERAAAAFYRLLLEGVPVEEARHRARADLVEQRGGRNRPGSYWVVADEPAVAGEARVVMLPADEVETLLVCSDGFTRAWEELGVLSGVAEALDPATPLDRVVEDIRTAERWRARSRLPLFAPADDTTALRLHLQEHMTT